MSDRARTLIACACALAVFLSFALVACHEPPPQHALIVRHPELKCGLVAFSDCAAYATRGEEPGAHEDDEDAGVAGEDASVGVEPPPDASLSSRPND